MYKRNSSRVKTYMFKECNHMQCDTRLLEAQVPCLRRQECTRTCCLSTTREGAFDFGALALFTTLTRSPRSCREEENLVFCFGAQFNSTLNFTQSGWHMWFLKVFRVEVTNVEFEGFYEGQWLRARLCCRKMSDSIFWLYYIILPHVDWPVQCLAQRRSKRNIKRER